MKMPEYMKRERIILHYASIATKSLDEKDPQKLEALTKEMKDLEEGLGMTTEEIISEAAKFTLPK